MENTYKSLITVGLTTCVKTLIEFIVESDSEDDESDDENWDASTAIQYHKLKQRVLGVPQPQNRIKDFVNIVTNYTGKQFQMHFRVTIDAFQRLLQILSPLLSNISESGGRPTIPPRTQLLSVLWLLATPECYRSVGDRFDLGKSSLFHCFKRVVLALNTIAKEVIKWPNEERQLIIKEHFHHMAGIPNVLGAVDGTYIKIKAPKMNPENYINRKCFYGITLQAICDHALSFTDCYVGFPSSVSDTRIFRNSDIYNAVIVNEQSYFPNEEFILGDKAYPLTGWCIPPYIARRELTAVENYFNTKRGIEKRNNLARQLYQRRRR